VESVHSIVHLEVKVKTKITFILLILVMGMLLALPAPVQATKPAGDLEIEAHLYFTGETSAAGNFSIHSEALGISDSGPACQTFHIDMEDLTIHGKKTLTGADGTIILKFQAQLSYDFSQAVGTFTIISGTGAYRKLHGVGSTNATIMYGVIDATYNGSAHFD
jgi:hypothetical protein